MPEPLTAIIVGAGHRGLTYASYAEEHPGELKIVGVADLIERRRKSTASRFGFSQERCFQTAKELASRGKLADCVINGTMDHQHVPTCLPLLDAGYDILLEKPFATGEEEMWALLESARGNNRKVMICHVLRYAPFYVAVRERVAGGLIGDIINFQTIEHVSYHPTAVGFVRGKWNNRARCKTSMLLAKCCHDLDLIAWMKSGVAPVAVSSFGSNMQFRPENAPAGAGSRCLVDCEIEPECLYSAKKHYIDHPERWSFYAWDCLEHIEKPSIEQKIESLKADNPYGRCVWGCDNDVVDHQSVAIEFADGSTATHNMVGGTARSSRAIHLIGTEGEIQGVLEDSAFTIRHIDPRPGHEYSEEVFDLDQIGDMHGAFGGHAGGDLRLVADFVSFMRGEPVSISCTRIEDSVNGHLLAYCADQSVEQRRVVEVSQQ